MQFKCKVTLIHIINFIGVTTPPVTLFLRLSDWFLNLELVFLYFLYIVLVHPYRSYAFGS